ncbi:MAG: hypothetical protein E6J53_00700 [Chloroflexi bacterium]|nr:MAG: hypothetical protein E6J53_00700 [Chloroflexota bacterium]
MLAVPRWAKPVGLGAIRTRTESDTATYYGRDWCARPGRWGRAQARQRRTGPHAGRRRETRTSLRACHRGRQAGTRDGGCARDRLVRRAWARRRGAARAEARRREFEGDAQVLRTSRVWDAIAEAWSEGASLAGSSAGAMALCSHTLIRATWPNRFNRKPNEALGLVPDTAVLPHFDTFGHRWIESARGELPETTLLGIDERSAAVYVDGGWRAAGPGGVTLIRDSETTRFTGGMKIDGLRAPARMLPSQ